MFTLIFAVTPQVKDSVPQGDKQCEDVKDNKDDPKMEFKLKNLKANTEYKVVMTAENAIGKSAPSKPMYFQTAKGQLSNIFTRLLQVDVFGFA